MKIHHTTEMTELGNCLECNKPILKMWFNKQETNGQSQRYTEKREGVYHYSNNVARTLVKK